jgi:hypothetical protein
MCTWLKDRAVLILCLMILQCLQRREHNRVFEWSWIQRNLCGSDSESTPMCNYNMKLLIFLLASMSVLALKCPELSCSSELSDSICARIIENQISVNLCTGTYSCSLQHIM